MEPIRFKEMNGELAKNQSQFKTLPVFKDPADHMGEVISCWKLTPEELMHVLQTGEVWVRTFTFNNPVQPVRVQVEHPWEEENGKE